MIPKIIHYCWFGNKSLSKQAHFCVSSWKKFLPDYKIVEWNETNFDVNHYSFCAEAYKLKKYAFVSDVCRIHVLNEYGGLYFDTDVEVIRSFDDLLQEVSFTGFEDDNHIQTAVLGSTIKSEWTEDLLKYYRNQSFILPDGSYNMKPNPQIFTPLLESKGILLNNTFQKTQYITVYPKDFFSPKDFDTAQINITENTKAIHHFSASWLPWKTVLKLKLKLVVISLIGIKNYNKIKLIIK